MPDLRAELDRAIEANRVLQRANVELCRQNELLTLKTENSRLRKEREAGLRLKVADRSGALSIYGLQKFPVTLFKSQWQRILDAAEEIRAFIAANDGKLRSKDDPSPARNVLAMKRRGSDR